MDGGYLTSMEYCDAAPFSIYSLTLQVFLPSSMEADKTYLPGFF